MMKRPALFASEALLCQSFAAACHEQDWTVYPETSGWDLLLVKGEVQIGIEAKLRANLRLLAQAVERAGLSERALRTNGPQHVGLLIPERDGDLEVVAHGFGFRVIFPAARRERYCDEVPGSIWPNLDRWLNHWHLQHFEEPAWLPPVVPQVSAGVPCPIVLSEWKVRALRFLARLELRGWVTIADMREFGMAPSRWYPWLLPGEVRGRWVRKPGKILADEQHPAAFAVLVEEARREAEAATVVR